MPSIRGLAWRLLSPQAMGDTLGTFPMRTLRRLGSGIWRSAPGKRPSELHGLLRLRARSQRVDHSPRGGPRPPLVDALGVVAFEPSCVVPDDPGEVVRHAAPLDGRAHAQLLEQHIARLRPDPAAVAARERRIEMERAARGRVLHVTFG